MEGPIQGCGFACFSLLFVCERESGEEARGLDDARSLLSGRERWARLRSARVRYRGAPKDHAEHASFRAAPLSEVR